MAGTRKAPAEKKTAAKKKPAARKPAAPKVEPVLEHDGEYWWIISGNTRLNAGRNERYAQRLMDEGVGR
jgi:hypothetical protein